MDNCDLKVPTLPLLTWTVATLDEAEGLVKTLELIGLERNLLPLAENGVVHQVGRSVHAAEGVVDRLVSDRQQSVVGHDGVKEDVFGVFAGHVLWRITHRHER